MLKETAMVVSTSANKAKVAIVRSEACGNCPAKSMCNTASGNLNILEVGNPVHARPGQRVLIELRPEALLKATTLVYLVPATAMVAGATTGWLQTGTDMGAMIGALGGFLITSMFLFLHSRKNRDTVGPVISEIQSPGSGLHA